MDWGAIETPLDEKARKARKPREADIVAGFRNWLRIHAPAIKWVAVPNAAKRGRYATRQAQREGMTKGFPDGLCLWPGGGICFLEWKRLGGKASDNQAEWLLRLKEYGFPVALVNSTDEAVNVLRSIGAPVREERGVIAQTFRCGHPRTPENSRDGDIGPRCATCRRALERRASQAYRLRKAGRISA